MSWRVLPDQLDEVAARWPTHGLAVVDRRQSVRYPELAHRVRRAALALARAGLRPGDNVGLLLPTCVEFYVALLGAMRAGLAPSPFAPPASAQRVASDVRGFRRALANGRCRALVIDAQTAGRLGAAVDDLGVPALAIEALDGEPPADAPPATLPVIDPARDLALIQYTSGSTSHPKGVALTHDQLAAGVQAIARGIALTAADVNGQWLPIHHDMGLIGSLTGLSVGVDQFLWSPMSFVRDPLRWLAGFAARRATIYAGPNFSYAELAARADDADLAGLDLSAWRVAFNGADGPIDLLAVPKMLGVVRPVGVPAIPTPAVVQLHESHASLDQPTGG